MKRRITMDKKLMIKNTRAHTLLPLLLLPLCVVFLMFTSDVVTMARWKVFEEGEDGFIPMVDPGCTPDMKVEFLLEQEGFPLINSEVKIKVAIAQITVTDETCGTTTHPLDIINWELIIQPEDSAAELLMPTPSMVRLTPDKIGRYMVKCTATVKIGDDRRIEYAHLPFTAIEILPPETEPLDPLWDPGYTDFTSPTNFSNECGWFSETDAILGNPQWVTVIKWGGPEHYSLLEGRVRGSRVSRMDNDSNHELNDFCIYVIPDPLYNKLRHPDQDDEVEVEWEIGYFPEAYWPTSGDRVSVVGYWINDCGHPPKAEIHPPVMVATHRARPIQIPSSWGYGDNIWVPGIVTDIWVNQNAGEITDVCQKAGLHQTGGWFGPGEDTCIPQSKEYSRNPIQTEFPKFNIYLPRNPKVIMEEFGVSIDKEVPLYREILNPFDSAGPDPDVIPVDEGDITYLEVTLDLSSFTGETYSRRIVSGWIYPDEDNWGLESRKISINSVEVHDTADHAYRPRPSGGYDVFSDEGDWWFWVNINNRDKEWTMLFPGTTDAIEIGTENFYGRPWETNVGDYYTDRNLGPHILLFPNLGQKIWLHTSGYEKDPRVSDSTGDVFPWFECSNHGTDDLQEVGEHSVRSDCKPAFYFLGTPYSECGDYTLHYEISEGPPVDPANLTSEGWAIYNAFAGVDPAVYSADIPSLQRDWNYGFSSPQGIDREFKSLLLADISPLEFSEYVSSLEQRPDLLKELMTELREEVDSALKLPLSMDVMVHLATLKYELPAELWAEYFGDLALPAGLILTYNQLDASGFPEVKSVVTVSDENGAPITGLTIKDFAVGEDGIPLDITVKTVDKKASAVSVALVIDSSDSMRVLDRLVNAKTAASDFVDQMGSPDKAAVISFGNNVTVDQDFTSNKSQLKSAINNLTAEGISFTAIYDALLTATDKIREQSGLKMIILLSDGGVDEENPGIDKVIDKVNQLGVAVYTIGLDIVIKGEEQVLRKISEETGGQHFSTIKSKELQQIYQNISQQLQNQYQITFTTPNPEGNTTRMVFIATHFYGQIDVRQKPYSSPPYRLIIPDLTASPGDTITVPINVIDAIGVAGADIVVTYDKDVLTIKEAKTTTLSTGMSLIANTETAGEIILSIASTEGITKDSGPLLDIVFTVSASTEVGAETALTFKEATLYDKHGETIPTGTQSGKITIIPVCVKGDLNDDGKIRANDAILALRIAVGLMEPATRQECAADMNDDGKVRANDAILILRKAVGLAAPSIQPTATIGKEIIVTLSEAHGVAGESITVPLKVDNVHELAGGDICIGYDRTVLRAVDVSSDSDVLLAGKIDESGMIHIAFASADKLNSQTVAEIRFDILADDVTPLTLQKVELYRFNGHPIDSRKVSGSFSSWAIPPEHSALLQNFPNPFNPETWIPYQLAKGGDVMIRIYNVKGQLVKTLDFGYQPAGTYTQRARAAYWDGLNSAGEKAASGIYFYQIKADDFSAMRKMVIVK